MLNTKFEFPLPYNNSEDMNQYKDVYQTSKALQDKIKYLFSHPTFPHHKSFNSVSSSGSKALVRDMAVIAVRLTRCFVANPQHYGHNFDNVIWEITVRMWKQTFKHMINLQGNEPNKHYGTSIKLLEIHNGIWDSLLSEVLENKWKTSDDMIVKKKWTYNDWTEDELVDMYG